MNKKKRKKYAVMCEIGSTDTMTIYIRAVSKKVITLSFMQLIYKGVTRISGIEEMKLDIVESAYFVK